MADPGLNPPVMTQTDHLSEVLKADPDHYNPEIVYEFSNGRQFESTDRDGSTICD